MNIGILKETGLLERRVALSPAGVQALVLSGHTVHVEQHAGAAALFHDEDYIAAGGTTAYSSEEVINRSDIVLKISPLSEKEVLMMSKGQTIFSFLHLAISKRKLLETLLRREVTAVAYELIENDQGDCTVLEVMSEIGGQMAVQVAAHFLQGKEGGRGILLGSIPGIPPASVVILGAGTVGKTAARTAIGMGASVTLIDKDITRLRQAEQLLQWNITTAIASEYNIAKAVGYADALIGAVLLKGEKTPHLVTEEMVKKMKPGAVIVDLSIDQGGCVETSRPTSLSDPVFVRHGIVHYCVPNMTASVGRTATLALTNAMVPYLRQVADVGMERAILSHPGFARGVCTYRGQCTNGSVARIFDLQGVNLLRLLADAKELSRN
ncbi:MAG TPA: alanine dehydrogenase [Bacteroidota bacterium]|nr:alanine dehydrogenase [Bacteroidota bacterium]